MSANLAHTREADPSGDWPNNWLNDAGESGRLLRAFNWGATDLGPIDFWPASLRTSVGLCLASNSPLCVIWGIRLLQIHNDSYRRILGGNHAASLGQDYRECWAAAWPVLGVAFERALAGYPSRVETQRMFVARNGSLEEAFLTFSFSPIRDESGAVAG